MNFKSLLGLFFVILVYCMQTNTTSVKQTITISGKIINWSKNKQHVKRISLYVNDFISSEQKNIILTLKKMALLKQPYRRIMHRTFTYLLQINYFIYMLNLGVS